MKKIVGIIVLALLFGVFAYISVVEAKEVTLKKVDYVSIILDQSGSMYMKDVCHKDNTKMTLAKKAISNVLKNVPELSYDTRFSLASKDVELLNSKFEKGVFLSKVSKVRDEGEIFGNLTNLYDAVSKEVALKTNARKSAVILVTDGDWNKGKNPVDAVKELYSKKKDCVVHIISLSDTSEGEDTIAEIAALNPDTLVLDACSLLEESVAKEFAEYVFYGKYTPVEVYFNFDSAVVLDTEKEKILAVKNNGLLFDEVNVEGCACVIGTESYNKVLSTKRAESVAKMMDTQNFYGRGECTEYKEKKFNRHAKIILK